MDRVKASAIANGCVLLAAAAGVGAGAYWAWWNGKNSPFNPDPVPSMFPWIALAVVSGIALLISIVLWVILAVTPSTSGETKE